MRGCKWPARYYKKELKKPARLRLAHLNIQFTMEISEALLF